MTDITDTTFNCPDCDSSQLPEADNTLTEPLKIMDSDLVLAASVALAVPSVVKFAPVLPPVKGNYILYCLAIKWVDNSGTPLQNASNACHATAKIYKDLSFGYLVFSVIAKQVNVDLKRVPDNVHAAEQIAIRATGQPQTPHVYAIFNGGAGTVSHGSGDTAHLLGALTRDVCHEVGHCHPTDLAHSGKYDANGKLLPYDDGTSFMGRFSSDKLTGAQIYLCGWFPENKVAQYDIGDAPMEYNIDNLFASNDGSNVKMVLIPRATARPIYLSMPQVDGKAALAIHMSSGRGSQRVAVFGSKASYAGLLFEKVAEDATGFVTVRVSTQTV